MCFCKYSMDVFGLFRFSRSFFWYYPVLQKTHLGRIVSILSIIGAHEPAFVSPTVSINVMIYRIDNTHFESISIANRNNSQMLRKHKIPDWAQLRISIEENKTTSVTLKRLVLKTLVLLGCFAECLYVYDAAACFKQGFGQTCVLFSLLENGIHIIDDQ